MCPYITFLPKPASSAPRLFCMFRDIALVWYKKLVINFYSFSDSLFVDGTSQVGAHVQRPVVKEFSLERLYADERYVRIITKQSTTLPVQKKNRSEIYSKNATRSLVRLSGNI